MVGLILRQDLLVLGRPAGQVVVVLLVLVMEGLLPLYPNELFRRFLDVPLLQIVIKMKNLEKTYFDNLALLGLCSTFAPDKVNWADLIDFVLGLNKHL